MFCPQGFTSLSDLENRLTWDFQDKLIKHISSWYEGDDDSRFGEIILRTHTMWDFAEYSFLRSIEKHAHICSPSGVLLKFDMRELRTRTEFWELSITQLEDIVRDKPDLPPIPKNFNRMYDLVLVPFDEIAAEAKEKNQSLFKVAREHGYEIFHQDLPFFYERSFYTISLAAVDYVRKLRELGAELPRAELEENADVIDVLRPFEGWALCVPNEYVADHWPKVFAEEALRENQNLPSSAGRPPIVRVETLATYRRLFPMGHGGMSWPRVMQQVNRASGHQASIDTLKRALREDIQAKAPEQIEAELPA
jgi:hypothetical protein